MKRVIITGATSMIGVALVKACIANNVEVTAVVRPNSPRLIRLPQSPLIKVVECDLSQIERFPAEEKGYDVFYHLAWSNTSKELRDDPEKQLENVETCMRAVDLAAYLECKKFIGAGSQAEYGYVDGKITPKTKVDPVISYGVAKYAAGKLAQKKCERYGMACIWARIFSVYGINDNPNTLIRYALECHIKGIRAKFSAGTQLWNYLFEDDAGQMFYELGEKVHGSGVFCIASADTRPLKQFILELKAQLGEQLECSFAEQNGAKMVEIEPDISDFIEATGYTPSTSFKQGIQKIIRVLNISKSK